ncbi:MAG: hypothetical protein QMC67_01530 [Candidatus Wallbacteria bacterium]
MFNQIIQRRKSGFTILETLIAATALVMVFGSYFTFMSGQNKQIQTITQRSEADENCSRVLQYLSSDIKSAKRECLEADSTGNIKIIRFTDTADKSKSDQLYLEKVEYKYDSAKREITRTARKLDYDTKSNTFKENDVYATNTFKNISKIALKKINMPDALNKSGKHILGLGIEIESEIKNSLVGQAQLAHNQDVIYVKDEIAYQNQPNWNVNPIFSKKLVNITLSPPLEIDFASALEVVPWAKNLKNGIPAMIEDAKKQILDDAMTALSSKAFEKANEMFGKFVNESTIGQSIARAKNTFLTTVKDKLKEPKFVAAAAMLQGAFFKGVAIGEDLKNKILNKTLSDAEIRKFIGDNFGTLRNIVISDLEFKFLKDYEANIEKLAEKYSNPPIIGFGNLLQGKLPIDKYSEILTRVKNLIYDAIGTQQQFADMVNAYTTSLTEDFRGTLKNDFVSNLSFSIVETVVKAKINDAAKLIKVSSGLEKVIENVKTEDKYKDVRDIAVPVLEEVGQLIDSGLGKVLNAIANQVLDKIKSEMQENFKDADDAIAKAASNIPDAVNSTISMLSKKFLLGENFNAKDGKFIADAGKNYLKELYDGFKLPMPDIGNDKETKDLVNKYYSNNGLDKPKEFNN